MGQDNGFSLLELLVAIAVMAMLAGPLSAGLHKGLTSWEIVHTRVEINESTLLMRDRLRAWFSAAYPADPRRTSIEPISPFVGLETQVSFIAAVHPDGRADDLYSVELKLNEDKELAVSIISDVDSGGEEFASTVLLNNIETLSFSYLEGGDEQLETWENQWVDKTILPLAIRLQIEFEDENTVWTPLITPLLIKEWAHCAYDPVALACRSGIAG